MQGSGKAAGCIGQERPLPRFVSRISTTVHHTSVLKADGDIGHSWLQSFSQEEPLAMICRQDTIMKLSEPGDEAAAPLWTPEMEEKSIRSG